MNGWIGVDLGGAGRRMDGQPAPVGSSVSDEGLDFKVAVLSRDGDCVLHEGGECEGDVQAHHVITQQQLRKRGLGEELWDPDNGAAVCERHHRRHHNRREPIPLAALPARARLFAESLGLGYLLTRYYAT